MKYAKVVVDIKADFADKLYTYLIGDLKLEVGIAVKVPFGSKNTLKKAVVFELTDSRGSEIEGDIDLKSIDSVLDDLSFPEELVRLAKWVRNRYFTSYADVVGVISPKGDRPKRALKPTHNLESKDGKKVMLTPTQQALANEIKKEVEASSPEIFLLKGVAGSGKTEIYINAVEQAVASSKSGIVLLPEIALTKQITARFREHFGDEKIAIIHSGLTRAQRFNEFLRIRDNDAMVVIGARSAVFAPVRNLGIIIIDEEQDSSYKATNSPRYDAVEVGVMRSRFESAPIVLGSATPAISDYYRAKEGKLRLLSLDERYNGGSFPDIEIVNMADEMRRGNFSPLSTLLRKEMRATIDKGKQVLLFLNRRGYAPIIMCESCKEILKCEKCGIPLVYHREDGRALCHYCGSSETAFSKCKKCGSKQIQYRGLGIEQLTELVQGEFKDAKVARLDSDVAVKAGKLEEVLEQFSDGKIDVLIGTQIISKGLDFENVTLAGIIEADAGLQIPDFRADERVFQLIVQTAGRAGRRDDRGKVVLQTLSKDADVVNMAAQQDYEGFYSSEIAFRKKMGYPPFGSIIKLEFSSDKKEGALDFANSFKNSIIRTLEGIFKIDVLGPVPSFIQKSDGMYRYRLILKMPREVREKYSHLIRWQIDVFKNRKNKASKKERILVDAEPYDLG